VTEGIAVGPLRFGCVVLWSRRSVSPDCAAGGPTIVRRVTCPEATRDVSSRVSFPLPAVRRAVMVKGLCTMEEGVIEGGLVE
jgi:hypothetical protein